MNTNWVEGATFDAISHRFHSKKNNGEMCIPGMIQGYELDILAVSGMRWHAGEPCFIRPDRLSFRHFLRSAK